MVFDKLIKGSDQKIESKVYIHTYVFIVISDTCSRYFKYMVEVIKALMIHSIATELTDNVMIYTQVHMYTCYLFSLAMFKIFQRLNYSHYSPHFLPCLGTRYTLESGSLET